MISTSQNAKKKKLLRAAMVKARVDAIHTNGSWEVTKPIDDPSKPK